MKNILFSFFLPIFYLLIGGCAAPIIAAGAGGITATQVSASTPQPLPTFKMPEPKEAGYEEAQRSLGACTHQAKKYADTQAWQRERDREADIRAAKEATRAATGSSYYYQPGLFGTVARTGSALLDSPTIRGILNPQEKAQETALWTQDRNAAFIPCMESKGFSQK